jgi:hypothetical protein
MRLRRTVVFNITITRIIGARCRVVLRVLCAPCALRRVAEVLTVTGR